MLGISSIASMDFLTVSAVSSIPAATPSGIYLPTSSRMTFDGDAIPNSFLNHPVTLLVTEDTFSSSHVNLLLIPSQRPVMMSLPMSFMADDAPEKADFTDSHSPEKKSPHPAKMAFISSQAAEKSPCKTSLTTEKMPLTVSQI